MGGWRVLRLGGGGVGLVGWVDDGVGWVVWGMVVVLGYGLGGGGVGGKVGCGFNGGCRVG